MLLNARVNRRKRNIKLNLKRFVLRLLGNQRQKEK
jgi:hypothetical protein